MRATIFLRDIVGIAETGFLVGICPLQGGFDGDRIILEREIHHFCVQRRLQLGQMFDKGSDTAVVFEDIMAIRALIGEFDAYARIEERQLSQTLGENFVVKLYI